MVETGSSKKVPSQSGFTLVELMITSVISMLIMASIYSAYLAQQRVQTAQEQVVQMQSNIRSLLTFLTGEIRLAGFGSASSTDAGITSATASRFGFKWDKNQDADVDDDDEFIEYGFKLANDPDDDGLIAGSSVASFCRRRTNLGDTEDKYEPLAENISGIEFYYVLEDDTDNDTYDPRGTLTPSDPSEIREIKISILARTDSPDRHFTNNESYTTSSGKIWGPYNDHYRRRLLTTTVKLRNMGL